MVEFEEETFKEQEQHYQIKNLENIIMYIY